MWSEQTGFRELPSIGSNNGQVFGCSLDGRVAVGESGLGRALRWVDGVPSEIPSPAGFVAYAARDADATGTVVVGDMVVSNGTAELPFIWRDGVGTMVLADYLAANGVIVPSGWSLLTCRTVNGDGTVFAGEAATSDGHSVGWVGVIPAPGGLGVTVAFWLLSTPRRRRRCFERSFP